MRVMMVMAIRDDDKMGMVLHTPGGGAQLGLQVLAREHSHGVCVAVGSCSWEDSRGTLLVRGVLICKQVEFAMGVQGYKVRVGRVPGGVWRVCVRGCARHEVGACPGPCFPLRTAF